MFLYREVKHTDVEALGQYLADHGDSLTAHMAYLHSSMVLEIDGALYGFAAFKLLTDTTALLMTVQIAPSHRGQQLGDGLIKALLNTAELRGITAVFSRDCAAEGKPSLMDAVGFKRLDDGERLAFTEIEGMPGITHIAHLPEYFKTACKSKRQGRG